MSRKQYMANILVAEDNRLEGAMLENMLQGFGCTVDIATGLDVADRLDEKYSIIFLDINMPGISGFNIAKSLQNKNNQNKNKENDSNSPAIIFLSSEEYDEEMKNKCLEYNVDGYIQKPMTKEILGELLEEFIPVHEISIVSGEMGSGVAKGFFRKVKKK